MRTGLVSSSVLHASVLVFMLVSFASPRPFEVPPAESMPIDIISDAELSQMMAGSTKAPKAETPKPKVEKVDTPKPTDPSEAKISDKPEIKASAEPPPPPPSPPQVKPEPKPQEPKPLPPKAEAKPDAAPPKAEAKPEPTPPKQAEALKPKPPEKKEEPKEQQQAKLPPPPPPVPPKKPPPPKPVVQAPPREPSTFDADRIAALLDKRTPQRQAAVGDTLSSQPTLGASAGSSARLSQTEIDALRARLMGLWSPPAGAANPEELIVTVRIRLNIDGTLSGPPQVVSTGTSGFYMTARESAIRAVFRGQPFDMLSPAKYEVWKDIEITFDPREMVRG
ncbi:MAG TPA: cell envelope biogenesis protein TolA [Xanthobacteraceae bacterium]|nr:cell envelope biogenesis protein TolA [Xanthobacteraceae bacterium]